MKSFILWGLLGVSVVLLFTYFNSEIGLAGPWSVGIVKEWDGENLTVHVVGTQDLSPGRKFAWMIWQSCGTETLILPYEAGRFTPQKGLVVEYYERFHLNGEPLDYQIALIHGPRNPAERC